MIATMYSLSRNDCKALDIKDVYSIHKAVYTLFPEEDGKTRDFLFVDKGGAWDERKILIISNRFPQQPQFGRVQSKEIPATFLEHGHYGFEVKVNPVIRLGTTKKHVPVKGRDELQKWFTAKSAGYGFCIEEDSLQVNHTGVIQFAKDGANCTYNTATFVGRLRVLDKQLFRECFINGIGRGKAFGFGLLQLVPLTKTSDN